MFLIFGDSFTLWFYVHAERGQLVIKCNEPEAYCGTFKALTKLVCRCLSEMGDGSIVLQILEKVLLEQIVSLFLIIRISKSFATFSYNNTANA